MLGGGKAGRERDDGVLGVVVVVVVAVVGGGGRGVGINKTFHPGKGAPSSRAPDEAGHLAGQRKPEAAAIGA
ncbi:unnamed protein product [Boreogadus saida]